MAAPERNKSTSDFVITRTFDAPRELVFEMWTRPEHLQKWLAPGGGGVHYKKADIRPGGVAHYSMEIPGGKLWGKVLYEEIVKPSRLVYVQSFSDEHEGLGVHPMAPTFPREMRTTVLFEAVGNQTKLTLTWVGIHATDEEVTTFENAKGGMTQGWGGSFGQLDAYLAKHRG